MATANGLYRTAGTVHSRYYTKQITRQLETAQSPPCSIHCNAESRILNRCCI